MLKATHVADRLKGNRRFALRRTRSVLICLLGFSVVFPAGANVRGGLAPAQMASVQMQVRQGLSAVMKEQFANGPAMQAAKALAIANVADTILKAKSFNVSDSVSALVVTAIGEGIPAPLSVAIVVKAALKAGYAADAVIAAATTAAVSSGADGGVAAAAIIVTALEANVPANLVGIGLGQATSMIALENFASAIAVAHAVGNEGTGVMIATFSQAVTAAAGSQAVTGAGGSAQLVAIANGSPTAAGAIQVIAPPVKTLALRRPPPCFQPSCS